RYMLDEDPGCVGYHQFSGGGRGSQSHGWRESFAQSGELMLSARRLVRLTPYIAAYSAAYGVPDSHGFAVRHRQGLSLSVSVKDLFQQFVGKRSLAHTPGKQLPQRPPTAVVPLRNDAPDLASS